MIWSLEVPFLWSQRWSLLAKAEFSFSFKNPKQSKKSKISKKSKNLTNSDFIPDTCQKIEKMSISNSRYRGIVVVEMLILLSRYRGIVAIQGNYPQKCCHSSMSSLRIMLLAKPYPANTYFPFS